MGIKIDLVRENFIITCIPVFPNERPTYTATKSDGL